MVVNPNKFQSIIITGLGKLKDSYELLIDNHKIDSENSVTLLGIEIDNKINFEKHVTALCQKAGHQMPCHAYISTLDFRKSKCYLTVLYSQIVTIAPLFRISALPPCHKKIEKISERALTLLHNYNYSSYSSLILKVERPTMEVSCLRRLAIEVFKTLKSLNSDFMCAYFKKASHAARRKNNLVVNRAKTTTFDEKSLRNWDLKIWNSLPEDVKESTSIPKFTEFIKNMVRT